MDAPSTRTGGTASDEHRDFFNLASLLDFAASMTILLFLFGIATALYSSAIPKARLSETLMAAGATRVALAERLAIDGVLGIPGPGRDDGPAPAAGPAGDSQDMIRDFQSGNFRAAVEGTDRAKRETGSKAASLLRFLFADDASEEPPTDNAFKVAGRTGQTESGAVEGNLLTVGRDIGIGEPPKLMFFPAALAGSDQSTVMLVCGRRPVPAGWVIPNGVNFTNVPDDMLPSVCRARGNG